MARSNETFNKKEKEKKRLKKQLEKKEKTAERKSNSSKGKSLEDMMAYIDENGNITTTRPTNNVPKVISAKDIVIGVPRQAAEEDEPLKKGEIIFFNSSKGYGFIKSPTMDENIFFHVNNLEFQAKEHDKVNFLVEKGPKGLTAVNIVKAD